ncbi:hypothetical protein BV925_11720 [Pectobacterium odoriferum]|nr:hypothetical protein BV925_11720 [Pectobacterium odoriferum]POE02066.1 hypothetical protein BV916_16615 [Pectobacterium odoriferum]
MVSAPDRVYLYPSYFKLPVCWLPLLTPVTYLCKLLGTRSVAAAMQLELFRVFTRHTSHCRRHG